MKALISEGATGWLLEAKPEILWKFGKYHIPPHISSHHTPCWSELGTGLELNFQPQPCGCVLAVPAPSLLLDECYRALGLFSIIKRKHVEKNEAQERRICQANLDLPLQSWLEKRSRRQLKALQVATTKALLWCPRKQWPQKMLHKVEKSDSISVWWLINLLANNNHIPFLSTAFLSLLRLLRWPYLSNLFLK